jgi:hypothetical protein
VEHDFSKALELWTLQNLLDISIILGILATGLMLVQDYYKSLESRLSLRVSIELWRMLTVLAVDFLLAMVVLLGLVVLNPDIMADIKIAIPFCPVATILFAVALVLRLFYGGHELGSANYLRAIYFAFAANVINLIGFSFVMEGPSEEYLDKHPSEFWEYVQSHLISKADPYGLELAEATFFVCFPILMAVFAWGAVAALKRLAPAKGQ